MTRLHRARIGGLGDEAAHAGSEQIALHGALGLGFVELRKVDGQPVAGLSMEQARALAALAQQTGVAVACLASAIGNWARPISAPFDQDLSELDRLAALGRILGTRWVRVMAYPNDGLSEADWEREVLRRFRVLAARARDHGLALLVENCSGWTARDPNRFMALRADAGEDVVGCLFDLGNPVVYGDDPAAYLAGVLPAVAHVHVKDARQGSGGTEFTLPGQGTAGVRACVDRLLRAGYTGRFSLEPHLAVIPHLGVSSDPRTLAASYRAYLNSFLALIDGPDVEAGAA